MGRGPARLPVLPILVLVAYLLHSAEAQGNVVALAQARRDLSTFVKAVEAAGLTSRLSSSTHRAVVLVPTDEAFARFFERVNTTFEAVPREDLVRLLLYHHIPSVGANPVLDFQNPTSVTTEKDGSTVRFVPVPGQAPRMYVGGLVPGAYFDSSTFFYAGQSTVYIIDEVLQPPPDEISVMWFFKTANLTSFAQFLKADEKAANMLDKDDMAATIFCPSNPALTLLYVARNKAPMYLVGTPWAERVVWTHFVSSRPYPPNLLGTVLGITNLTADNGEMLKLNRTKDGTLTVQSAGTDVPAKVLKTLYIGKSVVYMIDAVLYPSGEVFAPPAPPRPPLSAPAMAKPSLPILLGSALLTLLAPAVLSRLLSKLQ